MSVVLVAFPGAPGISEEAQLKDQELNSFLEKKVQGICSQRIAVFKKKLIILITYLEILERNNELTISGVFAMLLYEDIPNLPPGGGLDSK